MITDPLRTRVFRHTFLLIGCLVVIFPIYITFVASTLRLEEIFQRPMPFLPGGELFNNYFSAFFVGGRGLGGAHGIGAMVMVQNSAIMAVGITVSKIIISLLSSFGIVFFRFPGRGVAFWLVLFTLMLPVEVRIVPTYQMVSDMGLLNSYPGLIMPLAVSATATFLFRQYFMTIPDELIEAAKMDGATPMRFFRSILVPMSRTPIATLVVIQFVYGWNQYLWPLIATTERRFWTLMIGLSRMLATADHQADWHIVMAITIIAMIPTIIIVLSMQKLFVKGLTESEK
ncbi:glycerol-3-phosphate transporter [Alkalispirochaeta sphaeroplastigenens]|uniref:sn-glycerol-3-phosphate transport system permease protein UgpE n=1 Tax=Alkalispirochaeta sphaeroplastigenens TaxID=1187066 RepID=A0A2S4JMA7_9SPIO|nr:sn-glycerol-3-phosphate ABC transporter permease UgpE [Alkalispirochaeta sphaeroplastigenens]POR00674.1 glycerol-3-phosphate transporter [Alkalispirochaeta sphaeroplastigenens]